MCLFRYRRLQIGKDVCDLLRLFFKPGKDILVPGTIALGLIRYSDSRSSSQTLPSSPNAVMALE